MLGKLIKHEFRATARIMLPVMGALLALALLANLSLRRLTGDAPDPTVLRVIFILIVLFFGIGIVVTAVMAIVIMVSRFYRNLLKDEGYLMFTLPVSVHEHIWSKLTVSLVWFLATALLIFLVMSLTALNLSAENMNLQELFSEIPSWSEILEELDAHGIRGQVNLLLFQGVLGVILTSLVLCLHFYASAALGHMFSKNKLLLSIVIFVGISFVFNMTKMLYGVIGFNVFHIGQWDQIDSNTDGIRFLAAVTRHGLFLKTLQGAVLYLATVLGLKRGLNLE